MPITRLTAMIIATRGDDIHCTSAGPDPATGKYIGWITLGSEDRYRPLLDTGPEFDSHESARQAVQSLVEEIRCKPEKLFEGENELRSDPLSG